MTYLADLFMWCWCWAAYRLVIALPIRWPLSHGCLPYAGFYAYHDPDCGLSWRWSRRFR